MKPGVANEEDRKLLFYYLAIFWETDDAARAVPLLIDWANRVSQNGDHEIALGILDRLQHYVGPLDVPQVLNVVSSDAPVYTGEPAAVHKALQSLNTWWQNDKHKKPANWLLDRLAERGYETRSPDDVS